MQDLVIKATIDIGSISRGGIVVNSLLEDQINNAIRDSGHEDYKFNGIKNVSRQLGGSNILITFSITR